MTVMIRNILFCLVLLVPFALGCATGSTNRIVLNRCVIMADQSEASYVRYAINDLRSYLKEITGIAVSAGGSVNGSNVPVIVVGTKAARQVMGEPLPTKDLGEEGYFVKTVFRNGREYIIVSGEHPMGTKFGVVALMKLIQTHGNSAYIEGSIDLKAKPSFSKRGMHFNGWAFNRPYSFRSWKESDWKSYIDILGYHGVNLFYVWPFMEIMPVPLSKEDEAYLQEFKRIVEYAQKRHGMEVWMMQSPNRVATDDCGVRDPRKRPYWRLSQVDMNPADPEQFAAIVKSREALYRIVNNVDGVCTIDGDPGESPDSPLSEYARILLECRSLLDKYNTHGKQTKLINWMWGGWGQLKRLEVGHSLLGRCFDPEFQAETVQMMKSNLPEPWGLMSGQSKYLPICQREGVLGKTTFLPYGTIEDEPAYPSTNMDLNKIRSNLGVLSEFKDINGVMGNAQTPLLQLPHTYFYFASIWDTSYLNKSDREVLLDLSSLLYPDNRELLADCFAALKETNPEKLDSLVTKLDKIVKENKLGRPGLFGRKLFPNQKIVAEMLLMQLRLNNTQCRLLLSGTDREECSRLLKDYFDAYLTWDKAHGWHDLWGYNQWQLGDLKGDSRYGAFVINLARLLGDKNSASSFFGEIEESLTSKHKKEQLQKGCIEPMLNAVLDVIPLKHKGISAKATASIEPDSANYSASAATDGLLFTQYWPGALMQDNAEWLQLTWDAPQTFSTVVVYFLQHHSMVGRTIHLQKESAPGKWEDFATTVISSTPSIVSRHMETRFELPAPVTLDKIRLVNLLDVFEFEVY